ncbi:MAG TPA: hypothetical protein VF109_03165 [Mycobacteriales bacterium]
MTPVPSGEYELADGSVERFSCAAGPAGWRYVSPGIDLTLDAAGRQVRVELSAGGWLLRGGIAGSEVYWVRYGGPEPVERSAAAAGFTGASPGFLVAATRLLRLTPGSRARLRLVSVTGPALATRVVEQGWELAGVTSHPTELGPLPVARYRVTELDTGESGEVHVAGDVVLAAPGVQLASLESPPTL